MTLAIELRKIGLFHFLTAEDAQVLVHGAIVVTKRQGEAIVLFGEEVPGIFIVGAGDVGVYGPRSNDEKFASIDPGGSFGEMSFLDGSHASATVRAESNPTTVILLGKRYLTDLVGTNPAVAAGLYRGVALAISEKLRATNQRIAKEFDHGRDLAREFLSQDQSGTSFDRFQEWLSDQEKQFSDRGTEIKTNLQRLIEQSRLETTDVKPIVTLLDGMADDFDRHTKRTTKHVTNLFRFVEQIQRIFYKSAL